MRIKGYVVSMMGVLSYFMSVCSLPLATVFLSTSLESVSAMKYLLIAPRSKPIMTLFLHLFKVHSGSKFSQGLGLVSLRQSTKYFETYSNSVKHFKDQFFLVVPLNKEAHLKTCRLDPIITCLCTYLFYRYQTHIHFLTIANMYDQCILIHHI